MCYSVFSASRRAISLKYANVLLRVLRVSACDKAYLTRQQFLHHALFDCARFVQLRLECCELGVHVGQYGGDGDLFGEGWEWDSKITNVSTIYGRIIRSGK